MSQEFQREDRYIVIKRKDLQKVPINYRKHLIDPMFSLLNHLPRRQCVVVESDWPEYQLVWAMIEHRMAAKPVPDFNAWRWADELQQRLNAADQRVDELQSKLVESRKIQLSGCEFTEHELLAQAVRAARGTSKRGVYRWIAMKDAFGCGSGVANALCHRFGFDPDETVKP